MRRVVKVGGSLLVRDDLLESLPRWVASQAESETLIIVGGGELIDAIRHVDRVRASDPVETHWMCVDLLETTYQIFSQWFDWPTIHTREAFAEAKRSGFSRHEPTLVAVGSFYDRDSNCDFAAPVPLDWRTTTDTIAALLAIRTAADELVLLKSCHVDPTASVSELARQGVVDEALPAIASSIPTIRVQQLT